jgi:hypothetical protein
MVDIVAVSPVQFLLPIFFAADSPVGSDCPKTATDEILIVCFKLQGRES